MTPHLYQGNTAGQTGGNGQTIAGAPLITPLPLLIRDMEDPLQIQAQLEIHELIKRWHPGATKVYKTEGAEKYQVVLNKCLEEIKAIERRYNAIKEPV